MKTVFISFQLSDVRIMEFVESLTKQLQQLDIRVKQPGFNVAVGTTVEESVFDAIRSAALFVSVLPDYRPNVLLETGYALGIKKDILLITTPEGPPIHELMSLNRLWINTPVSQVAARIVEILEHSTASQRRPIQPSEAAEFLRQHHNETPEFTTQELEEFTRWILMEKGFAVDEETAVADFGYDFLAAHKGKRYVVEVKQVAETGKVSISAVQQVFASVEANRADKGLIVTNGDFTQAAWNLVSLLSGKVELLTVHQLLKYRVD